MDELVECFHCGQEVDIAYTRLSFCLKLVCYDCAEQVLESPMDDNTPDKISNTLKVDIEDMI